MLRKMYEKFILIFLKRKDKAALKSVCPREQHGFKCRRNNSKYNYYCRDCGRKGKGHDPDIVDRARYRQK